jgi:hypothetical protein
MCVVAPSQFPPPEWYPETIGRLIDEELPELLGELTDDRAWAYLYACTLWTETVGGHTLLHLNDKLKDKAGREQALRGLEWMESHFLPASHHGERDPRPHLDRVFKQYLMDRPDPSKKPPQRNNPTGRTFETCIQELIQRLCGIRPAREPQLHTLQGFELTPPGYHSQPDLALFGPRDFRLVISTKWTLRKERIGTYLHESWFYKHRKADLQTVFVLNEFNSNILQWLVNDPLCDRVYHPAKRMLLATYDPFGDVENVPKSDLIDRRKRERYERYISLDARIHDLSDLFADVRRLKAESAPLDPDEDIGPDDALLDDDAADSEA